jgi:hypothetical protein
MIKRSSPALPGLLPALSTCRTCSQMQRMKVLLQCLLKTQPLFYDSMLLPTWHMRCWAHTRSDSADNSPAEPTQLSTVADHQMWAVQHMPHALLENPVHSTTNRVIRKA